MILLDPARAAWAGVCWGAAPSARLAVATRDRAGEGEQMQKFEARYVVGRQRGVRRLHAAFNRRDLDSFLFTSPEPPWTGTSPPILC